MLRVRPMEILAANARPVFQCKPVNHCSLELAVERVRMPAQQAHLAGYPAGKPAIKEGAQRSKGL